MNDPMVMQLMLVDAFARQPFMGNPAAVCWIPDKWPGNDWLQPLKDRGNPQDVERAEGFRMLLVPAFERLAEGLSAGALPGPSGCEIAVAIYYACAPSSQT